MPERPCFECGEPASEDHHVVPRSLGGSKTVPLCRICHGLVHSMQRTDIRELTQAGLQRARARGVRLGRPRVIPDELAERIRSMRRDGMTLQGICDVLTAEGHQPPGGKQWWPRTISNVVLQEPVAA